MILYLQNIHILRIDRDIRLQSFIRFIQQLRQYMKQEGTQLKQMLLSKESNLDTKSSSIDIDWLTKLFSADNIKDGVSLQKLDSIKGYKGLQASLKTNLKTGITGNSSDKQWRSGKYGTNEPIVKPPRTIMDMVLQTFEDDTIRILCAAAIVSLILGILMHGIKQGWLQGVSILLAVVIISAVTACNDYMKQKQFRKLNQIAKKKNVNVIRNGQTKNMSVYELLVGDIVQVQTGQILNIDGIIFKSSKFSTDESSVTGQSDQVKKQDYEPGKKCNPFLISGSKIMQGSGYMIVLAVGRNSQQGISAQKLNQEADTTPLQQKLSVLADQIGTIGLTSAGLTFVALMIHLVVDTIKDDKCIWCFDILEHIVNYFIIAVSIIVIAVPEGLPLAVTITLAYSVGKMKDENNLVRFLAACQTMGGANNVCTDKTGTLTKNLMTVTKLWCEGNVYQSFTKDIKISKNTLQMLSVGVSLNSSAYPKIHNNKFQQIGNKTQCALLELAYRFGFDFRALREKIHTIETVPFSSSRKRMSVICKMENQKTMIFTKGAPDFLLPNCSKYADSNGEFQPIDEDFKNILAFNLSEFASHSLRTILICYREIKSDEMSGNFDPEHLEDNLIVLGLAGIKDPLKEGIPEAVNSCKRAGIVVRMVTGDNTETATAIAKDANILPSNFERPQKGQPGQFSVMQGKDFRQMVEGLVKAQGVDKQYVKNIKQFQRIIRQLRVLARSSPEDKFIIATGLKQLGNVVAMTGDGTNDAPALKKADIGFAMGIAGTQVAKQAAGIILLDDNFSSIITAIRYGRNIFQCIRKFLQFQLTVSVVALFMAFAGAVFLKDSPLTPVQMLWINLIMDTLAALALATQPPASDLLERMPISRNQKMISPLMWRSIVFHGLFQIILLSIILFKGPQIFGVPNSMGLSKQEWNQQTGQHISIFFDIFVFLQVFNLLNARKLKKDELNVFSGLGNNFMFLLIFVGIFVCQLFIVQFGGRGIQLVPLSLKTHLICIALGALSIVFGIIIKKFIPQGLFNSLELLNDANRVQIYDVDSQLKKIWKQPATMRRSSKHRH